MPKTKLKLEQTFICTNTSQDNSKETLAFTHSEDKILSQGLPLNANFIFFIILILPLFHKSISCALHSDTNAVSR
jgi:hypothetical protein